MRLLCDILLITGFNIAIGVHTDASYRAWAIEAPHLSVSVAFFCAAACGAIYARKF